MRCKAEGTIMFSLDTSRFVELPNQIELKDIDENVSTW